MSLLVALRHARFLADEPYTRCKPSPGPRSFATAYGVELLNVPGSERVYLFMTGGSHSFRVIYMDGRTHPRNPEPSPFGHSIGWWEGDTLAIDTVGFNEGAWMDRYGLPSTDELHTLERVTRVRGHDDPDAGEAIRDERRPRGARIVCGGHLAACL